MAAATRAIQLARAGERLYFEEGPIGDIERDALVEGLPLWFAAKAGSLYLAANASWPGLFKIGCTRKSVEARMRQLSGAGMATPWVACRTWRVHDAHGLEAQAHRACEHWRVKGELFHATAEVLEQAIDAVVAHDRAQLVAHLSYFLPEGL
ncbi:hypothetical protein WL29_23145 [Burkholderia ubonensis]|uniref:Bacteriophage T5 Orf172 DNA-binding domain-containing protein n=2 Tax=Burkholderia ubonensis TaxID=101571 RepID=A0A106QC65_9BURK|nr:hypothetical protein WL29_23145 [Burkholderia ubonensis]